jgi:predicted metal-dependent hydrolase
MEKLGTHSILLGKHKIPYVVRTSHRATRYHISISHNGLEVVLPPGIPPEKAESLLRKNSTWILTHWKKIFRNLRRADIPTLPKNSILYRGILTPIQMGTDPALKSKAVVEHRAGSLLVRVPDDIKRLPQKVITQWLVAQARILVDQRVDHFSHAFGLHPKKITIRNQRTRWGSCSSTRTLSFNWRLVMVPPDVLDYIIIHELSHMDVPNHSVRFWSLVASRCPAYKKHRLWLKRNSFLLQPNFE